MLCEVERGSWSSCEHQHAGILGPFAKRRVVRESSSPGPQQCTGEGEADGGKDANDVCDRSPLQSSASVFSVKLVVCKLLALVGKRMVTLWHC